MAAPGFMAFLVGALALRRAACMARGPGRIQAPGGAVSSLSPSSLLAMGA
ncbi:hypothetical protein [Pikeienuella sp. HZG-20]